MPEVTKDVQDCGTKGLDDETDCDSDSDYEDAAERGTPDLGGAGSRSGEESKPELGVALSTGAFST